MSNMIQHLAGALGYSSQGLSGGASISRGTSHLHQPTVLVSQATGELQDRMYADLIECLRYARDSAERRAVDAEQRAQLAEARLHELYTKIPLLGKDERDI